MRIMRVVLAGTALLFHLYEWTTYMVVLCGTAILLLHAYEWTTTRRYARVGEVRLCIEMCGRRFALPLAADATTMQGLGDALCAGGVVLGKSWVVVRDDDGAGGAAGDSDLLDRDGAGGLPAVAALRDVATAIRVNGALKHTGGGAECPLGGPVESLVRCCCCCSRRCGVCVVVRACVCVLCVQGVCACVCCLLASRQRGLVAGTAG